MTISTPLKTMWESGDWAAVQQRHQTAKKSFPEVAFNMGSMADLVVKKTRENYQKRK